MITSEPIKEITRAIKYKHECNQLSTLDYKTMRHQFREMLDVKTVEQRKEKARKWKAIMKEVKNQ